MLNTRRFLLCAGALLAVFAMLGVQEAEGAPAVNTSLVDPVANKSLGPWGHQKPWLGPDHHHYHKEKHYGWKDEKHGWEHNPWKGRPAHWPGWWGKDWVDDCRDGEDSGNSVSCSGPDHFKNKKFQSRFQLEVPMKIKSEVVPLAALVEDTERDFSDCLSASDGSGGCDASSSSQEYDYWSPPHPHHPFPPHHPHPFPPHHPHPFPPHHPHPFPPHHPHPFPPHHGHYYKTEGVGNKTLTSAVKQ